MAVLTIPPGRTLKFFLRFGGARRLIAFALLCCAVIAAPAPPPVSREYEVKAVFLYNFAQFVEWPSGAFADAQAPFVIGVLGDDPFGAALEDATRGENVNGRPIAIRHFRAVEAVDACHVLFISRSESGRLGAILGRLKGRSILTVSDAEGFTQLAGMIRFVTENNKVRLHINVEAAKAADLTISSKLLRPAVIVSSVKG